MKKKKIIEVKECPDFSSLNGKKLVKNVISQFFDAWVNDCFVHTKAYTDNC